MGLLDDRWSEPIAIPHPRRLEAKANKLLKGTKPRRSKRQKPKHIPRMSYRTYMGSAYWKARKKRYFRKFGKGCAVCGQKRGTTLHHKRYNPNEYGREPDDALIALCGRHHGEFHDHFGVRHNMAEDTDLFVKHTRQLQQHEADVALLGRI